MAGGNFEDFDLAFQDRFRELEGMFSTPSSKNPTPTAEPGGCEPCATLLLGAPQPPAASPLTSLLYLVMLAVAIGFVAYAVLRRLRREHPSKGTPGHYAAQHARAGPQAEALVSTIEETDPEKIIPVDEKHTFVFFHAPWCGHCKVFLPMFEAVALKNAQRARFKSVQSDVMQKSSSADKVALQGFPTIKVYKGGVEVDQLVGNQGLGPLEAFLTKILG
jgi:thioredoxin 1